MKKTIKTQPLRVACQNGYTVIVRMLLATGRVNPAAPDEEGDSDAPLRIACKNGHTEIVRRLLATGRVHPAATDEFGPDAPLRIASENGHTEIVRRLIATGKVHPKMVTVLSSFLPEIKFLLVKLHALYNLFTKEDKQGDHQNAQYHANELFDHKNALTVRQKQQLIPYWNKRFFARSQLQRTLDDLPDSVQENIRGHLYGNGNRKSNKNRHVKRSTRKTIRKQKSKSRVKTTR